MPPRRYRVFEDSTEPTYLQLFSDCLTITYENKSIIYIHNWNSITELKPLKLSKLNSKLNPKDLKHNLFEVYIDADYELNAKQNADDNDNLKKDNCDDKSTSKAGRTKKKAKPKITRKLFRFDSRNSLDEFLTEAIRIGCIERIVEKHWLSSTIRYLPCVIKSNNNEQVLDSNDDSLDQ